MIELIELLLTTLGSVFRSRKRLILENLLLRQQLQVALRCQRRPRLRTRDKLFWLLVRHLLGSWRRHLLLVRPHREHPHTHSGTSGERHRGAGCAEPTLRVSGSHPAAERGACPIGVGRVRELLQPGSSPSIARTGHSGAEPPAARRGGCLSSCPQRLTPRLRASRLTPIDFSRPTPKTPRSAGRRPAAVDSYARLPLYFRNRLRNRFRMQ